MSAKKRVLIVEDDRDIRCGLAMLMQRRFDVVTAEDAVSAAIAVRRELPDVILLDLGLPGGDGLGILERLHGIPEVAGTPTIVVTGRDRAGVVDAAYAAGAKAVFQKPADPGELMDAVRDATAAPRHRQPHVLVVDDDADTREALAIRLRREEFAVTFASDGATALMAARRQPPDLVVLDLGLPCGDGLTVLRRLRAIDGLNRVPVVVISGREPGDACASALEAGADVYLQKPVDAKDLVEAARAVL